MNDAKAALNEVRAWLCNHLQPADAGAICCILADVSLRVHEADKLEKLNAELCELLAEILSNAHYGADFCHTCNHSLGCTRNPDACTYVLWAKELGVDA